VQIRDPDSVARLRHDRAQVRLAGGKPRSVAAHQGGKQQCGNRDERPAFDLAGERDLARVVEQSDKQLVGYQDP
jgi:hypothetical protein